MLKPSFRPVDFRNVLFARSHTSQLRRHLTCMKPGFFWPAAAGDAAAQQAPQDFLQRAFIKPGLASPAAPRRAAGGRAQRLTKRREAAHWQPGRHQRQGNTERRAAALMGAAWLTFSHDGPLLALLLLVHAALGAAWLEGGDVDPPARRQASPLRHGTAACSPSSLQPRKEQQRRPASLVGVACPLTALRSTSPPPAWGRSRGWRPGPPPRLA
jgi:hypothetical protein